MAVTAALVLSGGGALKSARAGDWQTDDTEFAGTSAVHYDASASTPSYDSVEDWTWRNGGADRYSRADPSGVGAYVQHAGRKRLSFKWVRRSVYLNGQYGPDPSDNPPDSLTLLITAGASATAFSDADNSQSRDPAKQKVEVSAFGQSVQGSEEVQKSVKQLVQVPTNGQETVYGPWMEVYARAEVLGDRSGRAYLFASVGANAQVDDRKVTIARDGAPTPKQEAFPPSAQDHTPGVTVNGTPIDPSKDEWIGIDGTGHGHSRYSFFNGDRSGSIEFVSHAPNTQTFNSVALGSWSSSLTWKWQTIGPPYADTINSHKQEMRDGSLDLIRGAWSGTPTADTPPGNNRETITYTLTDNADGATAQAAYQLTLHDEWEVEGPITDNPVTLAPITTSILYTSNPIYDRQHLPEPLDRDYIASEKVESTDEEMHETDKGVSLEGEVGAESSKMLPFLSARGIDMSITGKAHIAISNSDKQTQLNQQGLQYDVKPPITLLPGYQSRPKINVWARQRTYNVRHWDASGVWRDSVLTVTIFDHYEPRWENPTPLPYNQGGPETPPSGKS